MFMYCEKCAYIGNVKDKKKAVCPVCDTAMTDVPAQYLTDSGFMFINDKAKCELEDTIKKGVGYDSGIGDRREEILAEKRTARKAEVDKMVDQYNNAAFRVTCPICRSHSVDKISNIGKIVKVGAFGILGAGDIGKIYKCKACGYRF